MNRTEKHTFYQNIQTSYLKINELTSSIVSMSPTEINQQLESCQKIVQHLLQNEVINNISSAPAIKLLCYQLILKIPEYEYNKCIKITLDIKTILVQLNKILYKIIWKNENFKKGSIKKNIQDLFQLYGYYKEFQELFDDFNKEFKDNENQKILTNTQVDKFNKKNHQNEEGDKQYVNNELNEKYQQIIENKEKKIKELTNQLKQYIVEQNDQQNLINQLKNQNIDMKQQIKLLNQKIAEYCTNQLTFQQKIQQLSNKIILENKQHKNSFKFGKLKPHSACDEKDQSQFVKQQFKQISDEKKNISFYKDNQKKDLSSQEINNLKKMLITQCIIIQQKLMI